MPDDHNIALVTCKFGGSSVADAHQIRKVAAILREDRRRRHLIVSAPGKYGQNDQKVTDLLYLCHGRVRQGSSAEDVFAGIRRRFEEIALDLNVSGISDLLESVEAGIEQGESEEWVTSRGEWLNAHLIAAFLGAQYVEAGDCIRFTQSGTLDPASYELTAGLLKGEGLFVIPGFYGTNTQGEVKTFSRGGSDISGAIIARAVGASAYENWTDVNGLLMADPRIVPNPRLIDEVTYQELRELAYMGASVLHDEAVFPVREVGIPIHICNTNAPDSTGTWIRASRPLSELPVVGVAGRSGFTTIQIEKSMMNQERGFGKRILEILERYGISYEHAPSSIDSMSIIMRDEELAHCRNGVLTELEHALRPDRLEALSDLALIATVGQGMSRSIGIASRLFCALAEADVNIRMINQGASEINIIVGVAAEDLETAIRAIYRAFVPDTQKPDGG